MSKVCTETQLDILRQLPHFFLSLGGIAAEESSDNTQSLFLSLLWFGPYKEVLQMTPASNLTDKIEIWSSLPNPEGDSDEYVRTLKAIYEAADKNEEEQTIILFTDGTFKETKIAKALSSLTKEGHSVYTVLCNKEEASENFWADNTREIYYVNNIEEWLPTLTQRTMGNFPHSDVQKVQTGWLHSGQEVKTQRGDVSYINAHIVAIPLARGDLRFIWEENNKKDLFQIGIWPLSFRRSSIVEPKSTCMPRQLTITSYNKVIAFYWVTFEEPDISVELDTETLTSVNGEEVTFEVLLESKDLPYSSLMNRSRCYQMKVESVGEEFRGARQFGNDLRTEWTWNPSPPYDESREGKAWIMITNGKKVIAKRSLELTMKFEPQPITKTIQSPATETRGKPEGQDKFHLIFPFNYVPSDQEPTVLLRTEKDHEDLESITREPAFDETVGKDDSGTNFYCPKPNQEGEIPREMWASASTDMGATKLMAINPKSEEKYQLDIYRFLITQCGYDTLIFKWNESDSTVGTEIRWECTVNNNTMQCSSKRF
jgi:hypothetical protein